LWYGSVIMAQRAEIYLVPGFLGFVALGELDYYLGVADVLRAALRDRGIEAAIHCTSTIPAGTVRQRAAKLAHEIAKRTDGRDETTVHLVGHSTGGLDLRLLLSPDASLVPGGDLADTMSADDYARFTSALARVRTAVGIAAPFYGTPIAGLAVRLSFDDVLRGVSAGVQTPLLRDLLSTGLSTSAAGLTIFGAITRRLPFLAWIDRQVLGVDPFAPLGFVERIGNDVGALRNLTQEGTDLANALWVDRKDVAYGCIVTGTNQPSGLIDTADPILYLNTVLFRVARALAAVRNPVFAYSSRAAELQSKHDFDRDAGLDVGRLFIDDRTSDGIVPSASQIHGTLLGVFESDHLDCVGHFPRKLADGTRVSGWVRSGATFTNERFESLWSRIAEFIAAAQPVTPRRKPRRATRSRTN
jgi:hypothetical protein